MIKIPVPLTWIESITNTSTFAPLFWRLRIPQSFDMSLCTIEIPGDLYQGKSPPFNKDTWVYEWSIFMVFENENDAVIWKLTNSQ